jgi:phage tail-like protein
MSGGDWSGIPKDIPEVFVGVTFAVNIDKTSIGNFTSCEGLGIEVVTEQREEGGNNGLVWQLPTRTKYSNIKLGRPIGPDSAKLTQWIVKALNGLIPTTGEIVAMGTDGTPVVTWQLKDVIPVRWTGPNLTVDTPKVFTETLEIAHHGFTAEPGKKPS